MAYIYKLTLLRDISGDQKFKKGDIYIGQCNGKRSDYFTGGVLPRSIVKKYGKKAFKKEIIVQGDFNQEYINELEKHYIQLYASHRLVTSRGLNWSSGGSPSKDCKGINAGEKHGLAKLSDKTLIELLDKYATGQYSQAELGKEYGVRQSFIHALHRRKTRKYLDYDFSKINHRISRENIGTKNGRCTITEEIVKNVREDYKTGKYMYKDLCEKYNSTKNVIGKLVRRETWKNIN